MPAQPKVSVVLPTYNSKTLTAAIDSAVRQTYPHWEILIVDDGSTDETKRAVEPYLKKFPEVIRYFYQSNRGVAAARNKGLQEAAGNYIAFLDDDDLWLPEKLEKQVALLETDPKTGFVYCGNYFVDETGTEIKNYARRVNFYRGDVLLKLFEEHFLMTPSVVFRRSCLSSVGDFREDLKVGEDYDFFLRLARDYRCDYVETRLWKRVVRTNSLSRQDFMMDANNDLKTLERFLKENPGFYEKNKGEVHRRLSDYHFTFGYQLLERGKNGWAFSNLLRSMQYQFSPVVLKNLCLCLVPYGLRKRLKKSNA